MENVFSQTTNRVRRTPLLSLRPNSAMIQFIPSILWFEGKDYLCH
jgi:hypothetical protein